MLTRLAHGGPDKFGKDSFAGVQVMDVRLLIYQEQLEINDGSQQG